MAISGIDPDWEEDRKQRYLGRLAEHRIDIDLVSGISGRDAYQPGYVDPDIARRAETADTSPPAYKPPTGEIPKWGSQDGNQTPFLSDAQHDISRRGEPSMMRNVLEAVLGGGPSWLWRGNKAQERELGQQRFEDVYGREIDERRDFWRDASADRKHLYEEFTGPEMRQLDELATKLGGKFDKNIPAYRPQVSYDVSGRRAIYDRDTGHSIWANPQSQSLAGLRTEKDSLRIHQINTVRQAFIGKINVDENYLEGLMAQAAKDMNIFGLDTTTAAIGDSSSVLEKLGHVQNSPAAKLLTEWYDAFNSPVPSDMTDPEWQSQYDAFTRIWDGSGGVFLEGFDALTGKRGYRNDATENAIKKALNNPIPAGFSNKPPPVTQP